MRSLLLLLFASFLLLILVGIDVGWSMILSAWFGIELKTDRAVDTILLPQSMMGGVNYYALVQIPLFILAGELMNRGGLTQRLIDWALSMVGHFRGSLGHVSVLTNLVMAGVSGSAVADAVAIGKPLIPAMRKENYGDGYAGAVVAAGALLGPIIPPSIPMVVYAQLANESVAKMFISGLIPGLLLAAGFFGICTLTAWRRQYPRRERVNWKGRATSTSRATWALLMPVIILVGIRFGVVTETEVAAAAVLYALVVSLLIYRGLSLKELPRMLWESGRTSATILFLLAAAGPFSWLVAESQVSEVAVKAIHHISDNPIIVLIVINAFLLVVGSLIEPLPAMVIFLPALIPIGHQLGIDPIQFGAVVVINLMIGLLHPPIGLLLFVTSSVGKLRIVSVAWEAVPFLLWCLVVLALTIVFPPLTTWLPSRM
jgi:tripartite ATP-independent transporter DctM subunit